MSNPTRVSAAQSDLTSLIKRRRALALASTAIGLAGCGMLPSSPPSTMTPQQQAVADKVNAYTDVISRLDDVDRNRLLASAEKKPIPAAAATAPASTAPAAPAQASVILASAGGASASGSTPSNGAAAHVVEPATPTAEPAHAAALAPAPAAEPGKTATVVTEPAVPAASASPAPALSEKPIEKAAAEPAGGAAPLSGESTAVHTDVINPVATPSPAPVSAMGSMDAVASAQASAALVPALVTGTAEPAAPSVDDAIAILKKNISAHPTLSTSLALALLDGSSTDDTPKGLSEADQKVYKDLLGALETMKTADAGEPLADRAAPLLDAAKKWQAAADLSLPRLVLASRVDSFGVFTPISSVFEQGKRHTVIIYCEVANFAAQKGDDGWYTTHLTQQETLMTDDKLLVWRPNAEDVEDRSMNQRHDFYLVKKLTIPENLAAGKYTLVMSVTDTISKKNNTVTLPIEIK